MSNLIRCQNGHLFSGRRYGTICPYCNIETNTKEKQEIKQTDEDIEKMLFLEEENPVCGWIVCISGARRGKDYKIREGKNFIGRSDDMDIQILGDNKIERRNHAIIVFDPKNKETVLLPGDSNGLVYLNGNVVYSPERIGEDSVIEIGNSKFLFVAFCGDKFMWTDENENQDKNQSQ